MHTLLLPPKRSNWQKPGWVQVQESWGVLEVVFSGVQTDCSNSVWTRTLYWEGIPLMCLMFILSSSTH